jgi:AhpD family alkylhydroperoxidase
MMESPLELRKNHSVQFEKYKKLMPEIGHAYDVLPEKVFKDGKLDAKIKRLMALTGALVYGCPACILFQTEKALDLGADVEEILESCAVAISLGGTMAAGETTRVIQHLTELGKI